MFVTSIAMLFACADLPQETNQPSLDSQDPPAKEKEADVPSIVGEKAKSVWDYLRDKYDADQDGQISKAEYARGGVGWERLDRNTDGVLSAADFHRGGGQRSGDSGRSGGGESREARFRLMMTERAVMTFFQGDEDRSQLTLPELKQTLAGLDANADRKLDAEEFACSTAGKRWPGRSTPWEVLTAQFDDDDDGRIEIAALRDFVAARADEKGSWKMSPRGNRRGAAARGGGERGEPAGPPERPQGAPVGEFAPDFELAPPDGKKPVKLSSFRGQKPVALIFGSYT